MSENEKKKQEDFSIIENFISALNIEYEEAKKNNKEQYFKNTLLMIF